MAVRRILSLLKVLDVRASRAVTVCSLVCCLCCGVPLAGATHTERYYDRSRYLAAVKDEPTLPENSLVSTARNLFPHTLEHAPRTYLSVPTSLVNRETLTQFQNGECPSYTEITQSGTMEACPTYQVIERDSNRIPALLTQVKCRCLHCLGPWGDRTCKRCTPLFKFRYVIRTVAINNGQKYYALVREPQSFACACLPRHVRTRYVMAP